MHIKGTEDDTTPAKAKGTVLQVQYYFSKGTVLSFSKSVELKNKQTKKSMFDPEGQSL